MRRSSRQEVGCSKLIPATRCLDENLSAGTQQLPSPRATIGGLQNQAWCLQTIFTINAAFQFLLKNSKAEQKG